MASPFPGMDPYLEDFWRDVHASLVIYARDQLQGRLPGNLRARVEERVVVEPLVLDDELRSVYPDIRVVERGHGPAVAVAPETDVAIEEPLIVRLASDPMTETFIEIIDVGSGKQVVTVLEVLNLSNKLPGSSQDQYRRKRQELTAGRVSLVEIDLLRDGKRELSVPYDVIPRNYRTTYQVCVRRGWRPDRAEIYKVPLRQRLPIVRVPLRETDPDVMLDLQALIDQCYRNGGYDDDIDYRRDPARPLDPDDARWADELLRSQGRR
ncbi:MAG: DUF4058 family protein [Pirellulaceae bacterium]|nr:DUF4058 family protein [Pirellulaceae bacterium]